MRRLCVEAPLPFDEAAAWATPGELAAARTFAPARAQEYLAWRAIVRREIGADARIAYNAAGAPVVTNFPVRISVSHCRGRVAVALSDRPCALDIERTDRPFRPLLHRYLTPAEQALSDHPLFPAVAWCAKETLYKYAGVPGCDLRRDLCLDRFRVAPAEERPAEVPAQGLWGRIEAHLAGAAADAPLTLDFYQEGAFAVVFLFE